jgi:phospholipid/cholesterol/gamma-HCH transport system substrate-binding protein
MKRQQRSHLFTVLAAAVFTVAVLVGIMFFAGFWRAGKSYNVSVYVQDARGMAQDSTVVIAGLPVGLVTGIHRNGPDAVLSLRIDHGPTPLPVDSIVQVRLRSLAGEAYVQVYPGHSKQLVPSGGSLGISQDEGYTEVDQILSEFQGPTAGYTREFFQGLGSGVAGKGQQLNQTIGNAASLITDSLPVTSTLGAQHEQVADIVQNLGDVMAAVGQRTQAVQEFARGSKLTFTAVAARDAALRNLLARLPYALTSIRSASDAIAGVTPTVAPVLTSVGSTLRLLSPAVHELTPASQKGLEVLDSLGAASPQLRSVLLNLEKLQRPATAALPEVHATLCQVDPMVRYINPYAGDVAAFFADFGATSDSYNNNNHEFLASIGVDPNAFLRGVPVSSLTGAIAPALDDILNTGAFGKLGPDIGFDPAPPPGGDHDTTEGENDTGATEFGAAHKYPHVTADC